MEHLPTHTWPRRNEHVFKRLDNFLAESDFIKWKDNRYSVIDIGPGAAAAKYAEYLPVGEIEDIGMMGMLKKKMVNAFESHERDRTSDLVCFEAQEVYERYMKMGKPSFFFVDKYTKVIDTLNKMNIPGAHVIQADLDSERIMYESRALKGEIVIALNVIHRCRNPDQLVKHVSDSVSHNGLLVMNFPVSYPVNIPGFRQISKDIYSRDSVYDSRKKWSPPSLDYKAIERAAMGR